MRSIESTKGRMMRSIESTKGRSTRLNIRIKVRSEFQWYVVQMIIRLVSPHSSVLLECIHFRRAKVAHHLCRNGHIGGNAVAEPSLAST
jgi:hypothetical protein